VAVRIRGIVKAAREFEAHMLGGLPRFEVPSFLDAVRKIVSRVQRVCLGSGATVGDLPRLSRCAVGRLSALARLAPEDLGPIGSHPPPERRFRIANVMSNLARYLGVLGLDPGAEARAETLESMRGSVERIHRLCREAGTSPGRLPSRSAYAFAMMKWLAGWDVERLFAGPDRLDRYVEQVRLAREPLAEATALLWRDRRREVDVAFVPGHHVWRVKPRDGVAVWRLATGWLKAGRSEFDDLAAAVARRRGGEKSRRSFERHRAFTESLEFREIDRELERLLAGEQYRPTGRFRDLGVIFASVNRELFGAALARPRLHWTRRGAKARFGSYDRVRDVVCMNPVLDDPRVPERVTAYVLYHELLHKSHGFRLAGTRRMAHTREFAEAERRFPGWETASKWLELIAGGWDGPPPEAGPDFEAAAVAALEPAAAAPDAQRSSA
jgi:hypothetical protein